MTAYSDKLKDPRWQKKRLQVLELAEWKCEYCLDDSSPLHVHHSGYIKGAEPWEYPLATLHCLCKSCHENMESFRKQINNWLMYASISDNEELVEEILPNFKLVTDLFYFSEHPEKSGF